MRHRKKGKKIGRTASHRKRTLQSLSNALIENKRITTTVTKAKALRPFVEPLITRAKEDTQHNRREVFRHLQSNDAIEELFGDVSERVGDRPGGYTRIIKLGQRSGDGAELALIELVDYNDVPPTDTGQGGSGGTRRGSGKGRRTPTDQGQAEEEEAQQEASSDDAADEEASAGAEQDEDEPVDSEESDT
ncbi:50S ribosomal protein L17 [Salinibacter altiplanensis]|uniref:50S ribosomal protein L17 n=1 Tax=Salinibacter altiplanensis TaxID=1803181 RepID=UPI000C9F1397